MRMCARFTLKSSSDVVGKLFDLDDLPEIEPRYNIAPTQELLAIVATNGKREATTFRWGLIPSWMDDATVGQRMINARGETVAEKPSYRGPFKKRRCLIVADGFYEWTDPLEEGLFAGVTSTGKPKRQPHWIGMKDRGPFAFAGIWELNQKTELGPVETCAIITTDPNSLLEPMHDRMPVILAKEDWDFWLDPANDRVETLQQLIRPFPSELMDTYLVSTRVNSPREQGADLIDPIAV